MKNTVTTTIKILEVYSSNHFRAALPNGRDVIAHKVVRNDVVVPAEDFMIGDEAEAELNVYDFSKAKLLRKVSGFQVSGSTVLDT